MTAGESVSASAAGIEPPLRLGGRATLPGGELVVWSVADGRRGRRWREVTTRDGAPVRSALFETDASGRVVRLEMATAAGLLTLHPDAGDGVLHGNVVTPDGIRHLTLREVGLFVVGSPAAAAIAMTTLSRELAVGETRRVEVIRIDDRLDPGEGSWDVTRLELGVWRLVNPDDGETRQVRIDANGLAILPGSERWPLEV